GVVVHHVEPDLVGQPLYRAAGGDRVHHLGVRLTEQLRNDAVPHGYERGGCAWLAGADQIDLVALSHDAVGEIRDNRPDASVRGRWHIATGRYGQGHPEGPAARAA